MLVSRRTCVYLDLAGDSSGTGQKFLVGSAEGEAVQQIEMP